MRILAPGCRYAAGRCFAGKGLDGRGWILRRGDDPDALVVNSPNHNPFGMRELDIYRSAPPEGLRQEQGSGYEVIADSTTPTR